ncbi:MAG: aminoglycoside phosphotransferase family protein [Saprospiraceae bacterium]|nr:aminoglycoside phosphotransferase family protein [Saprospiraceae bacterium]
MQENKLPRPENAIAAFFGTPTGFDLVAFGRGNINDTWKLTIPDNDHRSPYLLQRLNHAVFKRPDQVMANISAIARHLVAKKYSPAILHPVATLEGKSLFCDENGHYWRVFPFFEHTSTLDTVDHPEQAFVAAQAFGVFLEALSDLDVTMLFETILGFHDSVARLEAFQHAVEKDTAGRLSGVQAEVSLVLEESSIFHTLAGIGLPLRAVHNDAKIGNILLDEQAKSAVAVIDWDTIMPGYLLSDLGDIARTMAASDSENEPDTARISFRMPVFQAICAGFIPPLLDILTPVEKATLHLAPRWIILEQAMRFLGDYLAGDVYYKTNHPLHNIERARNQIALYQSVQKQEAALRATVERYIKGVSQP